MSVRVGADDFDVAAEVAELTRGDDAIGAIATFIGRVRSMSGGAALKSMSLEHYPGMTEASLEAMENDARARFKLSASRIVHRVGILKPGDNIVLVVTAAPDRGDAFAAAEYLMDYLKTGAPFWKKEVFADGREAWIEARESDDEAKARWRRDEP